MNIFTLLCLVLHVLLVSKKVTTFVAIEELQDAISSREVIIFSGNDDNTDSDKDFVPEPSLEIQPLKDTNIINDTTRSQVLAIALSKIFKLVTKGNELRKQYEYVIPKIVSVIIHGNFSLNPFRLAGFIPYIMLAMQNVNQTPAIEPGKNQVPGLDKINMAKILENPNVLQKIFESKDLSSLAIDSAKVIAGDDSVAKVEALMKEASNKFLDGEKGATGINGKQLVGFLSSSPAFKNLVPADMSTDTVNMMNLLLTLYLKPEQAGLKDEFIDYLKDVKKNRSAGTNDSVDDVVRETLIDSSWAFIKVGKRIINEKLQQINSDAKKDMAVWKQNSATPASSNKSYLSSFSNMFVNNAPESVLNTVAKGNIIKNQYGYVVPQLASYFLPIGVSMDALKFVCLMTYVMLIARRENMIPEPGKNNNIIVPGLDTNKIIDTLNNDNMMAKIFPIEQESNSRVNILKFLAGPEAMVVDKIVDELKKIKKAKGSDQSLNKLTLTDVLTDTEFFKKLFTLKEYTDVKMKQYLGLDIDQLKNEIIQEMDKNYGLQNNSYLSKILPTYISNVLSATYQVGIRKATETMNNLNTEILKEADQMTRPLSSSEAANESTLNGMFRKVLSFTPQTVTYGLAGRRVLTGKISSYFQKADSGG